MMIFVFFCWLFVVVVVVGSRSQCKCIIIGVVKYNNVISSRLVISNNKMIMITVTP